MKHRILIVDDEESIREFLEIMLTKEGYSVHSASDGQEALDILQKKSFDLIVSDMQMPNMTGMELLEKVKQQSPDIIFIMITAFGTMEKAIQAMKLGAYDYLTKPFKIDEVQLNIAKALKSYDLESENRQLKKELNKEYRFQKFVGNSPSMHKVFEVIQRVAQAPTNVLITGDSGTGKEMVAKAIHYNGPFKDRPFVTVNCGAISEHIMESEMFGHKKGSFTGAVTDKMGLFESANGGILFLDEVGELPLSIQVKLLRAIQEKIIRRVGSTEDIEVDVRLMAATNRNLEEMVRQKTFREDLYYRIHVIKIHMPSLKERKEDIGILVEHFRKKYNERLGKNVNGISKEALTILENYEYPGNVRELENIIERTIALEEGATILPESLPPFVETKSGRKLASAHDIEVTESGVDLDKIMGQIEKELILKAVHQANGVKKQAAKILNISFRSMRYRADKYNIKAEDDDELE